MLESRRRRAGLPDCQTRLKLNKTFGEEGELNFWQNFDFLVVILSWKAFREWKQSSVVLGFPLQIVVTDEQIEMKVKEHYKLT